MLTTRTHRTARLIFALALFAGFGILSSSAVADESLFSQSDLFRNAQLEQLFQGDFVMAGNERAGMHLSSSSKTRDARYSSMHDKAGFSDRGIHLSWRASW